jgi:hypothetical protein
LRAWTSARSASSAPESPAEQADLAEEPARSVHPDDPLLAVHVLDDGHPALQDDVEVVARFAFLDEHLVGFHSSATAVLAEHGDLLVGEAREGAQQIRRLRYLLDARARHVADPYT